LIELFGEIADKWGFEIIAQEVMPDHVHLFVSAPPRYSPAKIAQLFKGITSRVIRLEFPEIKHHIRKAGPLWSPGYYVGTAGNVSTEVIRRYIEECQKI
jgi:putative transposase